MGSFTRTFLAAALLVLASCEETLEVCAPCAVPAEGNAAVSGDPRLDSTVEAVIEAREAGSRAISAFDAAASSLALAFGVELDDPSAPTVSDARAVVDRIRSSLLEIQGANVTVTVDRPSCWVDSAAALERQIACEEFADCFVADDCAAGQRGSCAGLCRGECVVRTGGSSENLCAGGACYVAADQAGDACLETCVGICSSTAAFPCPGRCHGSCDLPCSAYSSLGECSGACPGLCTGLCESELPIACGGTCAGLCRVPLGADGACAGTCLADCAVGACSAIGREGDGECRGHFRPDGCDMEERCAGVLDCREAGRCLAWTGTRCDAALARVSVDFSSFFSGSRTQVIERAATLERALNDVLAHYGWLSLLVDGADPAGLLDPSRLAEEYDAATLPAPAGGKTLPELGAFGYVEARQGLPLSGLKGRVGMLILEATGGDFTIAAGTLACVQPALEEAWQMLDDLLPMECTDEDDDGAFEACVEDRSGGLYRVLDGTAELFAMAWGEGA